MMHEIRSYAGLDGSRLAYALLHICAEKELPLADEEGTFQSRLRLGTSRVLDFTPRRSVLVVVPDTMTGERLAADLRFFLGEPAEQESRVRTLFGWEVLPFDTLSPTAGVSAARISALYHLLENSPGIVVSTPEALLQRVLPKALVKKALTVLRAEEAIERDDIVELLDARGYVRRSLVEEVGQMSVRGAVVDFFPPHLRYPVRVELFGDRIEAVRIFDAQSQRSRGALDEVEVLPAREVLFPWVLDPSSGDEGLQRAITQFRARASQLDLPLRTVEPLEDVLRTGATWPGLEHLQPLLLSGPMETVWDYLSSSAAVVLTDRLGVERAADTFDELIDERETRAREEHTLFPQPESAYLSSREFQGALRERLTHSFDALPFLGTTSDSARAENFEEKSFNLAIHGNGELRQELARSKASDRPFRPLFDAVKRALQSGFRVAYTVDSHSRERRIHDILQGQEIPVEKYDGTFEAWRAERDLAKGVYLLEGSLSSGLRSPAEGLFLLCDSEVFPEQVARRPSVSAHQARRFVGTLRQIKENDYIVHADHGVGIYRGLKQIAVEGRIGDYLTLEYAEGSKLFVPVENIGKIQKYVGGEGIKPQLTKLGGKVWTKTKQKVKDKVAELAGHLITLYAEREVSERPPFGPEDEDDLRFASIFPFQETQDQEKAINDVLRDMAGPRPMDRLVCGDVGYGKTEVALRAAFKAVNAGKQVAFLVPTTILADQHFATVRERFRDFAVRSACVSRFFTPQENRDTLEKVSKGEIDIIVGTHRLLQKDVFFKNLGLVVIDEEHKFGVKDKERLKRLRKDVDVLTLTATPIPRTLHMSLLDIRDLSIIETPPVDRQVIRTYVAPYQEGVVREAVLRELGRGGQVFFIHNRVMSIAGIAHELSQLVPEAKIEFAHGQMKDDQLEEIMHRFISGETQVLVSTTIVESGLDIPNANTIIIRDADKLGLAELYQLRGRVGRSSRRAYAYLLVHDPRTLGADAKKRLQVLQSLDDLGMGFRLALQDMEIRGAGNLLGKDQSGHIELVGFDLYSRILKETIRELRRKGEGAEPELEIDPEVNVGFPAHIPEFYIPDIEERLLLYQRLADMRNPDDAEAFREEFDDRFGNLPVEVEHLLELMAFRAVLKRLGITTATYRGGSLSLSFHPEAPLDTENLANIVAARSSQLRITPTGSLVIRIEPEAVASPADLRAAVEQTLRPLTKEESERVTHRKYGTRVG